MKNEQPNEMASELSEGELDLNAALAYLNEKVGVGYVFAGKPEVVELPENTTCLTDEDVLLMYEHARRKVFLKLEGSFNPLLDKLGIEKEDVASQIFLQLFARLSDPENLIFIQETFLGYMDISYNNRIIDLYRQASSRKLTTKVTEKNVVESGFDEEVVTRVLIEQHLNRLDPRYRYVLILSHYYGYSNTDIAKEFKITVGAAKALLHRARKKLQESMS